MDTEKLDRLGALADTVDNLLAAENLPLPPDLAKRARCASLEDLRDKMRELYIDASGENPWAHGEAS